jgi:16S rRNA (uracil1498-N3)-methyltransferase
MVNNPARMLPRFFVPDLDPVRPDASLPAEEARHLTRVLRLAPGDQIAVFDGRGHEFRARISRTGRDTVAVDLLEPIVPTAEPRIPLTLVQAMLKGDKMDGVVRDATMMGVAAIVPIVTARTIARPRALESDRAAERWRRVAIASAKQCRRATVPAIGRERVFADWLTLEGAGLRLMLVEPSAGPADDDALFTLENHAPASVSLLVGPEGGWTAEERRDADAAGCVPLTLGGITLRADAVAIAAIAIVRFALKDL